MRLFDKALTQTRKDVRDWLAPQLERTIVVDVDAIAMEEMTRQFKGDPNEIPFCVPQFERLFIEWGMLGIQQGALIHTVEDVRDLLLQIEDRDIDENTPDLKAFTAIPVICVNGHVSAQCAKLITITDRDGKVLAWAEESEPAIESVRIMPSPILAEFLRVICVSLSLMNCKNVTLDDVTEERQPIAKIRRRLQIPDVKRYTLAIRVPGRKAVASDGESESLCAERRLHLCRGHFASYTAERPLFGKLTGRFWVPAHARGAAKSGLVVKDYSAKVG